MLGRLFHWVRSGRAVLLNDAGIRHWNENRIDDAARCFERAVAADPLHAPSCNSLAAALLRLGRSEEAVTYFRRAAEIEPDNAEVLVNLGEALTAVGLPEEAADAHQNALKREPGHARAHALLLRPLLELCAWSDSERVLQLLTQAWDLDPKGTWLNHMVPFVSLLVPLPSAMRLEIARRHSASIAQRAAAQLPLSRSPRGKRGKLRVGYASADFCDHATAQLAAGLFEAHDRDRFEVFAYSFEIDDGSTIRSRLVRAFDRFVDVASEPPRATAQRIADDEIDILIDLKGYTVGCRSEIFAFRPAPVQASYLGYPGSMGADFIDYIVADGIVIPKEHQSYYSEKVVRLPGSYQCNDSKRAIAQTASTRAEADLPEDGFVFCCFNNNY